MSNVKNKLFDKIRMSMSQSKSQKLEWKEARDIKRSVKEILEVLDFSHIQSSRIFCFRTQGSKSRSYARIWSFPKIFQRALDIKPAYVIEVLSRHFDKLNDDEKKRFHYYNATVVYIKSATRIALGYGRQRAGIFCVGGVCRYVPASNGIMLSVTTGF